MSALAPELQGFFTERLIGQRQRQPPHHRRLPRRVPAAAALRPRREPASHRHELDARRPRRRGHRRVPRPPRDRPSQQCPHPQRPAGRHPLALPLRGAAAPRARRADPRVLAIPAKRTDRQLVSLPRPTTRSTRCSPHPTAAPGSAAVTMRCCSSPSRPACASPNSPRSPAPTSSWAPAPTFAVTARAAKTAITPLTTQVRAVLQAGSPSAKEHPTTRCSPAAAAARSAATPSPSS